jgi:hypothetical protein
MSVQLTGYWFAIDEPGELEIERRADGRWYDLEFETAVAATYDPHMQCIRIEEEDCGLKVTVDEDSVAVEAVGAGYPHYVFIPDPGECERVGLPVRSVTH